MNAALDRWKALPLAVRAGFLGLGVVLAFSGIELVARGLAPRLPSWTRDATVVLAGHPTRLWGLSPGVQLNAGEDATIGPHGLRGDPPQLPRPEGSERVLVLGDSSFFGHGLPDGETLAVHLASALGRRGVTLDTVNAGVPGYSLAQSTLLMDELGWSLEPSLVVVANLWSDNTWDAFADEDLLATRSAALRNPLVHSAAFRLLATMLAGGGGDRTVMVRHRDSWPTDTVRRVPPRRYGELLDGLVREAASRDVGVALLSPTHRDLVAPETDAPSPSAIYRTIQRRVADHHGLPLADMTPPFQGVAAAHGTGQLFVDDLHPSGAGQRIMADTLATTLVRHGWPGQRAVGSSEPIDFGDVEDSSSAPSDGGAASMQRHLFQGADAAIGKTP